MKLARWERQACARASLILASSELDRRILESMCPGVPVTVVPNAVDTDHYAPVEEDDQPTVLYQGGLDWYPNRDAVEYFAALASPSATTK